jgi:hypothetical protein
MDDRLSRRALLQHSAAMGAFAAYGAACSKQKAASTCTDTSGLSAADLMLRSTLAYADFAVDSAKICSCCQQFVPNPAGNACGTCKVVKGPISPRGGCKSFLAKPT